MGLLRAGSRGPARRLLLAATLFVAAMGSLVREAGAQDPRLRALRGIDRIQISVSTSVDPGSGGASTPAHPCRLDTDALSRRGADPLRAAGLTTMTFAERMARERANMAEDRRRLQALRAGDLEGARERQGAVVSTRGLPILRISMLAKGNGAPDTGLQCSLAAFTALLVPPRDWGSTVLDVNGVAVGAHLFLWEPRARLVVVPAAEFEAAAGTMLDQLVAEFVAVWREQNGR